jgi:DNA-binding beta-propeller fold protein YncE
VSRQTIRYNGPASRSDYGYDVAVSPDGARVFVTGQSFGPENPEYATVAYDPAGATQLWVARTAPPGFQAQAQSMAVSPAGDRVFVTGFVIHPETSRSWFLTVAYDAADGSTLWETSRAGWRSGASDTGPWLAVDPAGKRVYITGSLDSTGSTRDFGTLAYDAATGTKLWEARYSGPGENLDDAQAIGVSPDGSAVFVTGRSYGTGTYDDIATIAYHAATGSEAWVSRFDGPTHLGDIPYSLGVSPDGRALYVAGLSDFEAITIGYTAATGQIAWTATHAGPNFGGARASALALSPTGDRVYVTGTIGVDYGTLAYEASTGQELWSARYKGPAGGGRAHDIGVSLDGSRVYVTGASTGVSGFYDYATLAYDALTGLRLALDRYNGPRNRHDEGLALAVNPVNGELYVTGYSDISATARTDYLTIAYASL